MLNAHPPPVLRPVERTLENTGESDRPHSYGSIPLSQGETKKEIEC